MRTSLSSLLCLAFTLACLHTAAAQAKRRAVRPAGTAAPNTPAGVAPRAAPAPPPAWSIQTQPFAEDGEATTLVSLQPMPTAAAAGTPPTMSFGVNFMYSGDRPADFKNVSMTLFSRSKSCRISAEPAVVMNLDNRPLTLPFRPQGKGADGVFWVESDDEGGDCAETVIAYISPATLARIAAARSVRGKIGAEPFRLSAENLGALRALLAQLRLPQLSPAQPARQRARR
ncbi:MAG TPA: hypothetical protein VK421_06885 [Pyrinomonadaceae bacterium]|nr:hypothetical protein [Pyrinomonadaceae bacterium]